MQEMIRQKLNEIERTENVRILHAAEAGSRAWGFASPDSDYDVRFIYLRPKEFYLRLDKTRDVIEWQLDDTLDINGWDVQKALRLLHGSNPTLFEWNASPILYRTTDAWRTAAAAMAAHFSLHAAMRHYLGTAKGNYREYLKGETVRLKKYFYVLRPILACLWIADRHTPPPVPFAALADAYLDPRIRREVGELLRVKVRTPELGTGPRIDAVNAYIDETLARLEEEIRRLPAEPPVGWNDLNALFLSLLDG